MNKQIMPGYRLGLSKKDNRNTKKSTVPLLPIMRVGWKKALRKLNEKRIEEGKSVQDIFIQLSGSASRTSMEEDVFVTRLCKLLGPHVISKDDALSLSKKLLANRKTGYIIAKDITSLLDIREGDKSHVVFPDWLLQRQDFCAIQNNGEMECTVRNLRVVSAARACEVFRSPADNKCIFNWMKLHCSFLSKNYADKLMDFCREMEFVEFNEKEILYDQGDIPADPGMYMILTGILNIFKNGTKVSSISADGHFGEKALMGEHHECRNVTVETVVPTKCLFLSKSSFKRIVANPTQYPARQDIALYMCNYCAPFRHFSFQHILDTSRRIVIENYNGLNDVILCQNERPRGLYVIKSGVVDITRVISIKKVLQSLDDDVFNKAGGDSLLEANKKSDAMVKVTVATLRRGNVIGEDCLPIMVSNSKRVSGYTAVTASDNVELYFLREDECLSYLFKSEFTEEKNECLKDIKYLTENRRINDADLVLKYEKEIRTELMQRRLRRLNLQPVGLRNTVPISVVEKEELYSILPASQGGSSRHAPPESISPPTSPYRDQYGHRLGCLSLHGLETTGGRRRRVTTMIKPKRITPNTSVVTVKAMKSKQALTTRPHHGS